MACSELVKVLVGSVPEKCCSEGMGSVNVYDRIVEYLQNSKRGVLATVIRRSGSSPRDVGAKMFVGEDGKTFGSVGGGRLETEARERALAVMGSPATTVFAIVMDGSDVEGQEMLCGGNVEVLLEPVGPECLYVYRKMAAAVTRRGRGVVVTKFCPDPYEKLFLDENMNAAGGEADKNAVAWSRDALAEKQPLVGDGIMADPLQASSPLYLFGAGHVAQVVATIASIADFEVTVVDDSEEFANRQRFPEANDIVISNVDSSLSRLSFTGEEFVVVLTRSHEYDAHILAESLGRQLRYVGMIGSARKVRVIFDHLRSLGFDEEKIEAVHAPIGIPIGAQTPQEVAIAIVAELVAVRNGCDPKMGRQEHGGIEGGAWRQK
jgi:xanthine dehydrogenase accessory factor